MGVGGKELIKHDGIIGTAHKRHIVWAVMLEGSHLVFAGQTKLNI